MAKLSILNRNLAGFARRIGNIACLSANIGRAPNPRADGDDYSGRVAQFCMTLEDNAVVLMPLQYAPLIDAQPARARSPIAIGSLASGRGPAAFGTRSYDLKGEQAVLWSRKSSCPESRSSGS